MIGRTAYNRQAERYVDTRIEMQGLDRDQRLIMIHAQRCVIFLTRGGMKHGVGRQRTEGVDPFRLQGRDFRLTDVYGRVVPELLA